MRALTLDEKISIKGVLSYKGLILPTMTMRQALHYWDLACGGTIAKFYLYRNHSRPRMTEEPTIQLDL